MLLQLLRSLDLSWVVSVPAREAVTPSTKSLRRQLMKAAGASSMWTACWVLPGITPVPGMRLLLSTPRCKGKLGDVLSPTPGKGSCFGFFYHTVIDL